MLSNRLSYIVLLALYIASALYLAFSLPVIRTASGFSDVQERSAQPLFLVPSSSSETEDGRPSASKRSSSFARDCRVEQVFCIDDCSFLCLEGKNYRCAGNVCVPFTSAERRRLQFRKRGKAGANVDSEQHGCVMGVEVLTSVDESSGVRQWKCLCNDPTLFGGKLCEKPAPDTCERGVFLYGRDEEQSLCLCHPPYKLMWDSDRKPHCLEKQWTRFFPQVD